MKKHGLADSKLEVAIAKTSQTFDMTATTTSLSKELAPLSAERDFLFATAQGAPTSAGAGEVSASSDDSLGAQPIRVKGAGGRGKKCNGTFEYNRHFRKKPLYKNEQGAIVFWAGFWKMNYYDDTGSWYFAVANSRHI